MNVVRFAVDGRVHTGEARDGVLLDEAGRAYQDDDVVWLPPVEPRQVIGLALNYADHAAELSLEAPPEPALFFKPITSLVAHRAPVGDPRGSCSRPASTARCASRATQTSSCARSPSSSRTSPTS